MYLYDSLVYVRAGRRPPGESAAELTHPFLFARATYHTSLPSGPKPKMQ